jgi:hypothetical protein
MRPAGVKNREGNHAYQARASVCHRRRWLRHVRSRTGVSPVLSYASREDRCAAAGGVCSRHPTSTDRPTARSAMGATGHRGKSSWRRRSDWYSRGPRRRTRRIYAACSTGIDLHHTAGAEREASFRCQLRPDPDRFDGSRWVLASSSKLGIMRPRGKVPSSPPSPGPAVTPTFLYTGHWA